MRIWLLLNIIVLILGCKTENKQMVQEPEKIDTLAIREYSLRLKNNIDSLILHGEDYGSISCAGEFSFEEFCDSSNTLLKNVLYYTTSDIYSSSIISSYYENEERVLVNIKFNSDKSDLYSIEIEQNIYFDGDIQIREQILGDMNDLPTNVQNVIKNTL